MYRHLGEVSSHAPGGPENIKRRVVAFDNAH
jgi:hypothetical protein